MMTRSPHHWNRRQGGVAVIALICLSLLGLIIAGLLRVDLGRRGQIRAVEHRLQADWLVEAGLERAAARIAQNADYEGESWRIPAEALGGRSAIVLIEVESTDRGNLKSVRVRSDYPADGAPESRVRRTKTFIVRPGAGLSGGGA